MLVLPTAGRSVNVPPLPLPALEASTKPPCASAARTGGLPTPLRDECDAHVLGVVHASHEGAQEIRPDLCRRGLGDDAHRIRLPPLGRH